MFYRSITRIFALVLALGAAQALAGPPAVIEAEIPFYEGPGEHFPSLGVVGKGVHVRLLGCEGDWCLVLRRTQKGWVPANSFKLEYGQASAVEVPGAGSAGLVPDTPAAATEGGSWGGNSGGSSGGSRSAGDNSFGGKSGFVAAGSGDTGASGQGDGSPTFSTTQTVTRSDDTRSNLSGNTDDNKAATM